MELLLWLLTQPLAILCNALPRYVCQRLLFMPTLAIGASLYSQFQALVLVLFFCALLLAELVTLAISSLANSSEQPAGSGGAGGLQQPFYGMAVCYVYYSVFRVLLFFCYTMWTGLWETVYDMPTVQRVMAGQRTERRDDNLSPTGQGIPPKDGSACALSPDYDADEDLARRIFNRRALLLSPWFVLVCFSIGMIAARNYCEGWLEGGGQDFGCAFFDPAARLNRVLRFTIFLISMQGLQVFLALFPKWYVAIAQARFTCLGLLALLCFVLTQILVSLRVCMWLAVPVLESMSLQHQHYLFDCWVKAFFALSVLLMTIVITRADNIGRTGFSMKRLGETSFWSRLNASQQMLWLWLLVMQGLHRIITRGVGSAHSDAVVQSILHPLLMAFVCTVTFVVQKVSRYATKRPAPIQMLMVVASLPCFFVACYLCSFVQEEGKGKPLLLVVFVWLHLCSEGLSTLRTWLIWLSSMQIACEEQQQPKHIKIEKRKTMKFSVEQRDHTPELKLASIMLRLVFLCTCSFCTVIGLCASMAVVQQRTGFKGSPALLRWRALPRGVEINNAGVSVLTLTSNTGNASSEGSASTALGSEEQPSYMICGQTWHGLHLIDYALLSELPYLPNLAGQDFPQLLKMLLPHLPLKVTNYSSGGRPWVELELSSKNGRPAVSIVVVSGTLVDRWRDILEDIRMWTEPVMIQIIGTFCPLTRMWPRETTALVIGSWHRIMLGLGVKLQWQYKEILDHVRQMPADRQVVLTGHSLGAGMALVVGALTGRTAIGIQPPGTYHSLAKHQAMHPRGHAMEEGSHVLHQKSLSLVFEGDWIQNFDNHGGLVQTMACDQSAQSLIGGCHVLEGAVCHLLQHCGDHAGEFRTCTHVYNPVDSTLELLDSIVPFVQQCWQSIQADLLQNTGQFQSMLVAGTTMFVIVAVRYALPLPHQDTRLA
ncbi:unnamed protein product [Polarella glacialis]|uniref:Fungal lipase-like domain-containing protein n=2 Tax=Polarella glacialis TaxID=89957 RepID=A0A813IZN6_POLGL|nr:unnamed protein product [Polarella glacialis]